MTVKEMEELKKVLDSAWVGYFTRDDYLAKGMQGETTNAIMLYGDEVTVGVAAVKKAGFVCKRASAMGAGSILY